MSAAMPTRISRSTPATSMATYRDRNVSIVSHDIHSTCTYVHINTYVKYRLLPRKACNISFVARGVDV